MEINITNRQELNSAVKTLYNHVIQMCNDTDIEDVCSNFISAKDYLIAIYKHNVAKFEAEKTDE